MSDRDAWIFDFDNHYYESPDAFTSYQDRSLDDALELLGLSDD